MIKNFFKIAWRNMLRNKGFTAINMAGLSIGLACTLVIALWVWDEWNWDRFSPKYDRTYQVMVHRNFNNEINTGRDLMFPLAFAVKEQIPEIKNAVVTNWGEARVLAYGDKKLRRDSYQASADFFKVFPYRFLSGNAETSLQQPNSIVLTASMAKALFGSEDPMHKTVRVNNHHDAQVTGVVADPPRNATLQFAFVEPFNLSEPPFSEARQDWVNCFYQVFLETTPGADAAALNTKLHSFIKKANPGQEAQYFVHPMPKWRLYSDFSDGVNTGGMIDYIRLFMIIAGIILVIACINYMNLSTARSTRRAKEVGIRKTIGSGRGQLLGQFLSESVLLSVLAFIGAIGIVLAVLPAFNTMVDKELSLPLAYPAFWGLSLGVVLMVGLLAGSYPSFYLSSFRPVQILKGTIIAGRNATLPRKLLVTGQFTASIVLISAAVIVYMQLSHVRSRDLGYNPNNLVLVESSAEVNRNIDAIRQELLQSGQVASVLRTTAPVTEIRNYTAGLEWAGMAPGQQLIIAAMGAEPGFSQTLGIRMVEGRDFRTGGADSSAMVLNEAAVRKMGLKDPVGREVRYNDRSYTIVGVSADVVMASPYQPVEPMMILPVRNYAGAVHIRLKDGVEVQAALSSIGNVFRRFNPEVPFEYRFADQEFSRKFLTEELIGKLANLFTGLSIFISCLGLFGLVAFSVEKRRREIGIRKVLGAPVAHILLLVSREFLYLIGLAFVLAVPVAWWIMHQWLENFAYRTTVHPLLFAAVGVVMLLITLVTISLNAFRSAVSSPVRNLRSE